MSVLNLKLKERSGYVSENKGSVRGKRVKSQNVYENKCLIFMIRECN